VEDEMHLKIYVIDDNNKVKKEFTCVTDSIPRALQMYEKEAGEFEHIEYKIVNEDNQPQK
jgi:hypothetical protein